MSPLLKRRCPSVISSRRNRALLLLDEPEELLEPLELLELLLLLLLLELPPSVGAVVGPSAASGAGEGVGPVGLAVVVGCGDLVGTSVGETGLSLTGLAVGDGVGPVGEAVLVGAGDDVGTSSSFSSVGVGAPDSSSSHESPLLLLLLPELLLLPLLQLLLDLEEEEDPLSSSSSSPSSASSPSSSSSSSSLLELLLEDPLPFKILVDCLFLPLTGSRFVSPKFSGPFSVPSAESSTCTGASLSCSGASPSTTLILPVTSAARTSNIMAAEVAILNRRIVDF